MKKKALLLVLTTALLISAPAMTFAEEGTVEQETATVASGLVTNEAFLADITASYEDRLVRSERYTNEELNKMSDEEYIDAHLYYVEAEESFCNKYRKAEFEDRNMQYLFNKYCEGIDLEKQSCEDFLKDKDFGKWSVAWGEAYNLRADVIVELADLYNAEFSSIDEMRASVEARAAESTTFTATTDADKATITKAQQLLNDLGFLCGNPDGDAGKRTVTSVRRFQEVYGDSPIDGVIDDELIGQLEAAIEEKQTATAATGG